MLPINCNSLSDLSIQSITASWYCAMYWIMIDISFETVHQYFIIEYHWILYLILIQFQSSITYWISNLFSKRKNQTWGGSLCYDIQISYNIVLGRAPTSICHFFCLSIHPSVHLSVHCTTYLRNYTSSSHNFWYT